MSQVADLEISSLRNVLEILRSQTDTMPISPTSVRYRRAVDSLHSSLLTLHPSEDDSSPFTLDSLRRCINDWLVNQWLLQTPYTSASLYLDIISALYTSAVRAEKLPKTTLFSEIKAQLKQLGPEGWKSGIDEEIFTRALRLTKNAHRLISDDAIAADLLLLSLNSASILRSQYCEADTAQADTPSSPLIPLEQLALLKKEDLDPNPSAAGLSSGENTASANTAKPILQSRYCAADTQNQVLSSILNNLSLANARRRYVFPLRQSSLTPAQLKKSVAKIVNALFRRARLPQATDPNQTVEALWAYAALRTGIPASTLVAHLGHAPLGLPVLKLVATPAADIVNGGEASSLPELFRRASDDRAAGLSSGENTAEGRYCEADTARSANTVEENFAPNVGKIFLDNPPQWYAMSLRPGVRFTQVCRRIELLSKSHTARSADTPIQLFYPCEEIARAIGKKIVIKQRPFIHSVVFFKAKLTDIGPLFARIGDLAWCYRQTSAPGAPYAEISEQQFRLFQQTIARFTPDYEVASAGELELRPNDRVEIVGGLFAGHEATFVKSQESRVKSEDPHTIYRLNIVGDNGFEWRIGIDKRLAQKSDHVMESGH